MPAYWFARAIVGETHVMDRSPLTTMTPYALPSSQSTVVGRIDVPNEGSTSPQAA